MLDYGGAGILGNATRLRETVKSITLDANNTTKAHDVFVITGVVLVKALYGVVTTALGSNVTAAHWRVQDQSATDPITAAAGTTLSAFAAGAFMGKYSGVATALGAINSTAGDVNDQNTLPWFQEFLLTKKDGAATEVEFVYTTNNTPTSGVIRFGALWIPISGDGNLVAV